LHKKEHLMRLKFWIVGHYRMQTQSGSVWDFQGLFFTKRRAIKACKNKNYFIAPISLNQEIPTEPLPWPGLEFPFFHKRGLI